jgi:uncharacterized membrane protein
MNKTALSLLEKALIGLSSLGIVGMFIYIFSIYPSLPDTIPVHFNALGEPDRYGGKGNLFALPCIATLIFLLTMIIGRFPSVMNYPVEVTEENRERLYKNARLMLHLITFEIIVFLSYIIFTIGEGVQKNKAPFELYSLWIFFFVIGVTIVLSIVRSFRLK